MTSSFGKAAKALREQAGLSLRDLERQIPWSRAAIGHAETGVRDVKPELATALDDVLGARGLLIALAAAERDQRRNANEMKRRALLKGIAASGAAIVAWPATGRVSEADVAPLVTRTAQLRTLDDSLGGADTFELYLAEVKHTQAIIAATTHSDATRRALLAVLAEQTQLAGWAAFDAGWLDQSASLYATSRLAARDADEPSLFANAIALDAYQRAFGGRADPALARASCETLSDRVPAAVRALVYDRAAFTYAVSGLSSDAEAALGYSAHAIADQSGPPAPHWATSRMLMPVTRLYTCWLWRTHTFTGGNSSWPRRR